MDDHIESGLMDACAAKAIEVSYDGLVKIIRF